jgi:plasmid stabilization system protein ParE
MREDLGIDGRAIPNAGICRMQAVITWRRPPDISSVCALIRPHRLDEIYRYTRDRRRQEQADRYITGLFHTFDRAGSLRVMSRQFPAEFGVAGYFFRHERHFVHGRRSSDGDIGIVTILHERRHQTDRFGEDVGA